MRTIILISLILGLLAAAAAGTASHAKAYFYHDGPGRTVASSDYFYHD